MKNITLRLTGRLYNEIRRNARRYGLNVEEFAKDWLRLKYGLKPKNVAMAGFKLQVEDFKGILGMRVWNG